MLPLAERLKRSNLFTKAYGARKSISTPHFTLYVLPRITRVKSVKAGSVNFEGISTNDAKKKFLPLAGFVVSKKTNKSACLRNKMKRRIRESYRLLRNDSLNQWYVMILVIKEKALNASWADLCRTMETAFEEAAVKYGRK